MNKVDLNKVGLFCNARNEKNIKEWAAHHLLIGFDQIIIFDHKSDTPLTNIFKNFDKRVLIIKTVLNGGNIKQVLMNKAAKISKKLNLEWIIYLDADEFLILNKQFKGVKHFLTFYHKAVSVGINWLMFGSNHFEKDPEGLILENYNKSSKLLDRHVKTFVRPQQIITNTNPHFYQVKTPGRMVQLDGKLIQSPYCFSNYIVPFYNSPAYIAHYVYQSKETYKKRKVLTPADDGSGYRGNISKEIHNLYNDGINTQPQKYVSRIKDFLQFYN